ncbi:MAG: tetratricopeptide repeat protein [Actinomycetota bacterium]
MRRIWGGLPLLAVVLGGLQAIPQPAYPQTVSVQASDNVPGSGGSAAAAAESAKESALQHKKRGDEFRLRDDIGHAGEEYGKALSLYRGFSTEDRFMMARYLSWSGRFDEAIRELNTILSEDPGNADARIHLARCLAWKGDFRGSLDESSKVLAASPGNKDALLVRANALKWSGNPNAGMSIYKTILERGEDFDTRLALSQTFLSTGYIRGARDGAKRLTTKYPYQEKELKSLNSEIDKATRPVFGAGYGYYHDSDENRLDRYTLSTGFWTGAWRWGIGYLYTDARDPSRHASDQELSLSAESRLTEWFGVGGTAGVDWTANDNSGSFFVGSVRADAKVLDGRIGASVARNAFAETAQLIENRIRFTEISSYLEYPLPYRFTVRASYAARDYSDDNRSDDWQGSIRHVFGLKNPLLGAGYRIRYLDFRRETGSGYFDPSDYLSNRVELSVDYEKGRGYVHVAPFFGYQSYRRRGAATEGFFGGGEGVLGARVTDSVALELYGEGSDEAGRSASGFSYYQGGVRVKGRF